MLYSTLGDRQFRLVTFLGGDEIAASVEAFDVDAAPPYVALSYQWGRAAYRKGRSPDATYSLTLNGELFPVQQNLHDALRHLHWRLPKEQAMKYPFYPAYLPHPHTGSWTTSAQSPRTRFRMYVDAICIDQTNDKEKGSQVQLMKQIYEQANKVWGWLGVPYDEEETRLAIPLMERFNVALAEGLAKHDGNMNAASTQLSANDDKLFPTPGTDTYKGWLGIMEMFNQEYWKRTWVQQEATGAADTFYWCGDHSFSKVHLSAACYFGYHYSLFTDIEEQFVVATASGSSAWRLSTFRDLNGDFQKGRGASLVALLHDLRCTHCTLAVDKVFAPRNFAPDVRENDFVPDYSRSVEDVFTEIVAFYIKKQRTLDILGHVTLPAPDCPRMRRDSTDAPLPSWVPDWRDRLQVTPLYKRSAASDDKTDQVYSAAGLRSVLEAHIEGKTLVTLGARLAKIHTVSHICDNSQRSELIREWAPASGDDSYKPTGQTMDEAFRTTVVADVRFVAAYHVERGNMARWDIFDQRIDEQTVEHRELRYGLDIILTQMCFGRRLAHTEDGYMGLVPGAGAVGDLVCSLSGGSVLYVLRDMSGGNFKFIGESYIHGRMDGESATDDRTLETFRLV